jgi:hypothetical protein
MRKTLARIHGSSKPSRSLLELLEPSRQSIPIRAIFTASRQLDQLPDDPLKAEFEKRAVMDFEQPIRDVNSVIKVDADQVGVEGGMMDIGSGRRSMVPNRQRNRSPAP